MNCEQIIETALAQKKIEPAKLTSQLRDKLGNNAGALVSFTGVVRAQTENGQRIEQMSIEHYPGMTEKKLAEIATDACKEKQLLAISLHHRIGKLVPGETIVHLVVASEHRKNAFEASVQIVDWLKTEVPLWKKESGEFGERWVEPSKPTQN